MNYDIWSQEPKPKLIGRGRVSLSTDGTALAMDEAGERCCAELVRAKVNWMQSKGIMLDGFEEVGMDKHGRRKYRYQRWFLAYVKKDEVHP